MSLRGVFPAIPGFLSTALALCLPVFVGMSLVLGSAVLGGCGGGSGKAANSVNETAAQASPESSSAAPDSTERLRTRMQFPAVPVVALDGTKTDTGTLIRGKDSLVIFIQIGCEACEEVMGVWKKIANTVPPGLNVIAVTADEPDYAGDFVKQTGFPFPLYCDENGIFDKEYKVGVFPTMVGVPDDGRIAYIGKPVTKEFTPVEAYRMLMSIKEKRRKAGI